MDKEGLLSDQYNNNRTILFLSKIIEKKFRILQKKHITKMNIEISVL